MGLTIRIDTTHNKATMSIMKSLGKKYTFENVEAIDILNISPSSGEMYVVSQGDKTYGVNIPKDVLDGEDVPAHVIPASAIVGNDSGRASIMSKFAEKLRNLTTDYNNTAENLEMDAERIATVQKVKITRFYRRDSIEPKNRRKEIKKPSRKRHEVNC